MNAITNGNDDIEVVILNFSGNFPIPFFLNSQVFLDCCLLLQFTFLKNNANMKVYILFRGLEQLHHLGLCQPHRLIL